MQRKEVEVILGLGTNLGQKINNLNEAIRRLNENSIIVFSESKIYKTAPWGFTSTEHFYNMAIKVKTNLSPFQLLIEIKAIELLMGRPFKESPNYTSRIIDIDIIDFNGIVFNNSNLTIPHPLLSQRNFVLYPLRDIAANYFHPETKVSIDELITTLNDETATVVNIVA